MNVLCGTLVYPETCEETYQPVCACDGRVYNNMCRFQRAQCRDSLLTVINTGGCSAKLFLFSSLLETHMCEEGTTWPDDCNTCTCHHGLVTCTEMVSQNAQTRVRRRLSLCVSVMVVSSITCVGSSKPNAATQISQSRTQEYVQNDLWSSSCLCNPTAPPSPNTQHQWSWLLTKES
ncbi:hypothetical protein Pmani_031786 [Petrolisthes manimaculis]|uniref:Kazal-like domain-containing protein n=1 Tax=Petrolisthes manimaculis TaxID=1843537 RepID=A0AAE1NSZ5_9EUCA|nr:hypothetical protein Pmani_031786 [Petrolisthes manimaculis]